MAKHFITVAGNIGVGKSSLTSLLAERLGWEAFLEGVSENPFLEDFYSDMRRWSFNSQTYFLSRRLQQHHALLERKSSVIQDRCIYEDAEIFARNLFERDYMSDRDYATYRELYTALSTLLQPPDLVVYLRASTDTLRRRISMRGREYEQSIDVAYLERLNELYEEWSDGFSLCPLLIVSTDGLDYVQSDNDLIRISSLVLDRLSGRQSLDLSATD